MIDNAIIHLVAMSFVLTECESLDAIIFQTNILLMNYRFVLKIERNAVLSAAISTFSTLLV